MNYFTNLTLTPLTVVPVNLYKSFIVRFCWIGEAAANFKARPGCGFFCAIHLQACVARPMSGFFMGVN